MNSTSPSKAVAVYHPIVRTLHWLIALLILCCLAGGITAELLPKGDLRSSIIFVHKSFGVAVLALVLVRILARVALGTPAYAEALGALTEKAAGAAHLALYALMIAMPVSGWVMSNAGDHPVSFFGLYTLPTLVSPDKAFSGQVKEAHELFAWVIGAVIVVHLLATLWHVHIKRDSVLTRMWPRWTPPAKA